LGFNIVVVGSESSLVAKQFLQAASDFPWTIVTADALVFPQDGESCAHFFGKSRPSIVVCFSSEGEHSESVRQTLRQLVPYCAELNVPVIATSSYLALSSHDPQDEVPDTALVSKPLAGTMDNVYAEVERIAAELDKHVILRTSWVIDAPAPCLLSRFMSKIRGDGDYIVSDVHFGRPVAASFVSDALVAVIQQVLTGAQNWGLYHVQSSDKCSEAEFCDQLIRHAGRHTGREYRLPTVSSSDTSERFLEGAANLAGRKLTDDFGIQLISWRKGFGGSGTTCIGQYSARRRTS